MKKLHFSRLLAVLAAAAILARPALAAAPHPHARSHPRVIVVGGGLAGLVAAWRLEHMGISTAVMEATHRFGGRVATAHYPGGLHAEYGMQEIWQKSPLLGIVKHLGLKTEAADDPYSSLIIDGKLYPFVQDSRDAFFHSMFNASEYAAFKQTLHAMEPLYLEAVHKGLTSDLKPLQDQSFGDWLKARKLPHKVEQALRLTIEVELATSADDFSALSAILEYRTFLFKGERCFHVVGGNERIIQALASRIHGPKLLGARVTEVKRVRRKDGSVACTVTYLQNEQVKRMRCDAVVVGVPWILLHTIQFTPDLTKLQMHDVDTLGMGQYTVVHMIVDDAASRLWRIHGQSPFPILSSGPLGVIYGSYAEKSNGRQRIFSLLEYGLEAQAFHMVSQDAKRKEILSALDAIWKGLSKHVHDMAFYLYHPASVAFWPPGRSPLDAASKAIRTPRRGLFLCGDWTESSHSEGAVVSGLAAAREAKAFLEKKRPAPRKPI